MTDAVLVSEINVQPKGLKGKRYPAHILNVAARRDHLRGFSRALFLLVMMHVVMKNLQCTKR